MELMFCRNSPFERVFPSLSMSSSMASTGDNGFNTRRNTQIRVRSSLGIMSSSLRVPERWMSMAGKTRLSDSLRSRMTSMLPVPLNSSKMTSSMREPVSISAVAAIVSEPPSSILRAAPEAFGSLQCIGVHAAGEHLARRRNNGVVSAGQTRDGIKQNHHVAFVFDQALGFFNHHLRHLYVAGCRLVKGRRDHLAFHRALHVRNFFRTLVNQQNDEHDFRMIGGDGVGDVLQDHGLAGPRRRNDQAALAFADGREQVHHARGEVVTHGLKL